MSNEKNNIDELFRGKLRDFSVEAPDHVWKGIEASRTPLHRALNYFKSKKGAALGSFILLATVSSIAYFMSNDAGQLSQQNNTIQSIHRYNNTASIQAVKYTGATTLQEARSNNAETALLKNSEATNTSVKVDVTSTSALPNNSDNVETTSPKGIVTTTKKGNSKVEGDKNTSNSGDKNTIKLSASSKEKPSVTPTKDERDDKAPVITKNETKIPEAEADKAPKADDILNTVATDTKGDGIEKSNKSKGQSAGNIEPETNFRGISADIYTGGSFAMRSLTNNGANQNYFDAKQNAESYRPGFAIGARVNFDYKDNLKVRFGAQYTRFNQRINLEREYQYTTIETTTGIILDPVTQQPIGTVTRTDTVENTETARANATNTVSFIDIPVQLELNLYKKNKLSVFATAGGAINLRFTQTGSQLNQRLTGLDEISSANNPFKTNAGFSILAGAGISYDLCQRGSILFETTYQHGMSNVMKSSSGMNQSYRILTGTVGLRYRF